MNLEEMIKRYSEELMDFAGKHNTEALVMKTKPAEEIAAEEKTDKIEKRITELKVQQEEVKAALSYFKA